LYFFYSFFIEVKCIIANNIKTFLPELFPNQYHYR